jgi:carotenoid cleavage dioxygenase
MPAPESPFLSGNYAPVPDEIDAGPLPVEGTLPPGLAGTLYRNGPNPHVRPVEPYHWFTGDGMVHAITLERGQARYRNRWVRTPRFEAEAAAGGPLFAGFGQPLTEAAASIDTGVANTHVIAHAGRLLALEEAHLPTRLDPADLATIGYDDFGGALTGRFTAHPKHDPATAQLVFFSYSATGPLTPDMSWGTIEADGTVSRWEIFPAPYCSMVHDFAVTATRVVFPVLPLTGDMDRAMAGGPPFAWEPAKGAFLGVLNRADGAASLRWQPIAPCYVFHVLNAFDDGPAVVMDVVEYEAAPLFPRADGGAPAPVHGRLCRWHVDAAGQAPVRREVLHDSPGEFPRLDERRAGLPYRYGYRVGSVEEAHAIWRHDLHTGEHRSVVMPNGDQPSEAVFVPAGRAEGDGWLLSVVWQPARDGSALLVLDAQRLETVATVTLPRRVPFGFHGSFVGSDSAG